MESSVSSRAFWQLPLSQFAKLLTDRQPTRCCCCCSGSSVNVVALPLGRKSGTVWLSWFSQLSSAKLSAVFSWQQAVLLSQLPMSSAKLSAVFSWQQDSWPRQLAALPMYSAVLFKFSGQFWTLFEIFWNFLRLFCLYFYWSFDQRLELCGCEKETDHRCLRVEMLT